MSKERRELRQTLREEFNQMVFEGIKNDAFPQGGERITDFFVRRAVAATDRRIFAPRNVPDEVVYSNAVIRLLSRGEKKSTMSEPQLIAFMLQILGLTGTQRVLEIGTGTGYQAAILAKLASEVHSFEIVPGLAKRAENNLKRARIDNAQVHLADGMLGWPEASPYNAIILAASVPSIPQRDLVLKR